MELIMLGTGNAMVTECYNTCFILREGQNCFTVDGGGGNGILRQLQHIGVHWMDIRQMFVTHKHIDHILGIIWMIRMISQGMSRGQYPGEAYIYGHEEVIALLREMAEKLLWKKHIRFLDERIHLVCVRDGEQRQIHGHNVTFFDIHSTKEKQFGFCMELERGEKLTCCGDEPYHPSERQYVQNSKWLLHEAFCLYAQAERFSPYEKHHSTVKDACELAESLGVKNLVLYHTEDQNLANRKEWYLEEGARYFHGMLYVPDDLERIFL